MIEAIASAIGSTDGVNLLDVDPGISTNRTVYTFVGSPQAVIEGALNGARAASQLIDMTKHQGIDGLCVLWLNKHKKLTTVVFDSQMIDDNWQKSRTVEETKEFLYEYISNTHVGFWEIHSFWIVFRRAS